MLFNNILAVSFALSVACLEQYGSTRGREKRDSNTIKDVLNEIKTLLDKTTSRITELQGDESSFQGYEEANEICNDFINRGIRKITDSPSMGFMETSTWSLVPHLLPVSLKIDTLVSALEAKKSIIEHSGFKQRALRQFKKSQIASENLGKAVLGNMALSMITGRIGSPLAVYVTDKFSSLIKGWGGNPYAPIEKFADTDRPRPIPYPQPVPQYQPIPQYQPLPSYYYPPTPAFPTYWPPNPGVPGQQSPVPTTFITQSQQADGGFHTTFAQLDVPNVPVVTVTVYKWN
jgi:hypothetical protein